MKKYRKIAASLLCLALLAGCGSGEKTSAEERESETMKQSATTAPETEKEILYGSRNYTNPILEYGPDPWVVGDAKTSAGNGSFYDNPSGKYYYCYSTGNGVGVAEGGSIDGALAGRQSTVYIAPAGKMYSAEYWAPELHKIDGKWYIYVAADDGNNDNHRMYVLRGTTSDPTDPFEMVGKISDSTDRWAIDGTVMEYQEKLYFIWSGWAEDTNIRQNLYIAPMSDPCTISGNRVEISVPEQDWERAGGPPYINEGPTALVNGEDAFILYSGAGSWCDDYCIAQLALSGDDPLDAGAWKKSEKPIMSKTEGSFGPGHCSLAAAPDGGLFMIYHANEVSGSGWGGRSVRVQRVELDDGGIQPAVPVAPGERCKMPFRKN